MYNYTIIVVESSRVSSHVRLGCRSHFVQRNVVHRSNSRFWWRSASDTFLFIFDSCRNRSFKCFRVPICLGSFFAAVNGCVCYHFIEKNCAVTSHPNRLNWWVHCSIIQWASRRQFNEFRSLSLSFFPIRSCRMQYYSGLNFKWQRTHTDSHKTMRTHKNLLSKQIIGINSMHYSSPFAHPLLSPSRAPSFIHIELLDISACRRGGACANLIKTKEKCRLGSVYNSWFNCAAHETKESSAKHLYSELIVVQRQTAITTK